ncbi:MAG TPA: hypothetical protein PKD79_03215 [Candidatus Doudnabacteria bacterium]|nr:hypothetical protein [Candidatus Doudnabacteria bacterium]
MTKQKTNIIYVMARELFQLATGTYIPEVAGFEKVEVVVTKSPDGRLLQVKTDQGGEVNLFADDALGITCWGQGFRIPGPTSYKDQLRQAIAVSIFSQKILEYSDAEVEINAGEKARVLKNHNTWSEANQLVPANYGKLIVVYEEQGVGLPVLYRKFIVRNKAKHNQMVLGTISAICEKFPQTRSEAFDRALKEQWEPFALNAAEQYYSTGSMVT